MIHSRLVRIAVLQSIYPLRVINIFLIYTIERYTLRGTFYDIVHRFTSILFSIFLICNCHGALLLSKISNLFICGIFEHKLFHQSKKSTTFDFLSTRISAQTKSLYPKPSDQWKTEHYRGSDDSGEVDIDSDINFLASGNLWQHTTVTSQCERLTWTWTWRVMYFDHWSHLEKIPGII